MRTTDRTPDRTTGRKAAPRASRRLDRRGATLVLVSLLMVPLVTLAAFSLDVGWWQVGANQLQTTADAAALAAARAKQLYPSNGTQAKVEAYANQVAAANKAFAQTMTIAGSDIEPVVWSPTTRTATVSNWTDANAVRVTARATPAMIFAGVTRATAPTIVRTSVAWIANVNSGVCVKPWALPYETLYDKVATLTGIASTSTTPAGGTRPDLSQAQVAALTTGSFSENARVVVIRGPTTDAALPPAAIGVTGYSGQWEGYNFAGNAGNQAFQSQIYGCDPTRIAVNADQGATLPGNAPYECWMVRALMGSTGNSCSQPSWIDELPTREVSCHFRAPSSVLGLTGYNAGCYATASSASPGISRQVSWGDIGPGTGANTVNHRVIGRVRILCVFRGLGVGAGGSDTSVETCAPGGSIVPISNLPIGTMVVSLDGLTNDAIDADTQLGTTIGTSQRLMLVR